jgi:cytochrome c-type biogenesis protein CcmH/NrfG
MGWLILLLLAAALFAALWRFARIEKGALQLLAAGLLLAMAGYAWQGRPGLVGAPVPPPERQRLPDTAFAETRHAILGRFDTADRWLTIADSYHRSGKTQDAVGVMRSAIRIYPRSPDLWIGLGNALVVHGGGMSPAAELAFRRADEIAPNNPATGFFYGLALAQSGRLEEAERVWRAILLRIPAQVSWRPMVEERLAVIDELRRIGALPPG